MINRISEFWCKKMHHKAMWPMHGKYICPQCLREHRVSWESRGAPGDYVDPTLRAQVIPITPSISVLQ